MFAKVCPYCGGRSYSAANSEQWICPYCKMDITGDTEEENVGQALGGDHEDSDLEK